MTDDCSLTLFATDCDPEVVTQGSSATVNITSEGLHSLSCLSVDNAGNAEALNVLTIRIDGAGRPELRPTGRE